MKLKLLFLFLILSEISNAQTSWRAKLYVHFLDSNNQIVTDTVWFGCDSLGGLGYQEGLDVIDTDVKKNKVLGFDPVVQSENNTGCVNLKRNIRNFVKDNVVAFPFYAFGKVVSISWDTLDFIYPASSNNDTTFKFRGIMIKSSNAFLRNIDAYEYILYDFYNPDWTGARFSREDSINVINNGSPVSQCDYPFETTQFTLEIWMGHFNVSLDEEEQTNISIHPNPVNDVLVVENVEKSEAAIFIRDIYGNLILSKELIPTHSSLIDVQALNPGVYYVTIQIPFKSKTYKLIKL